MQELPNTAIDKLLAIMAQLRNPEGGCPWDCEQNFASIAPHTIEEAYEVKDAIDRGDWVGLKEELGDVLLQVVFHAQMAREEGKFDFAAVVETINHKLITRHPHVFGETKIETAQEQEKAWEAIKEDERAKKQKDPSALADIARALPAMMRAEKLQKRAARVGFDWHTHEPVLEKIQEEIIEVEEAIERNHFEDIKEELGDLLFCVVNLARKLQVDAEESLRSANQKFEQRFRAMEKMAEEQEKIFSALTLIEQEALWQSVKQKTQS